MKSNLSPVGPQSNAVSLPSAIPALSFAVNPASSFPAIRCVSLANARYLFVSFCESPRLVSIDLQKLSFLNFSGHFASVRHIHVAGSMLYTASFDRTCRGFDIQSATSTHIFSDKMGQLPSVCAGRSAIFTASYDSDISYSGTNTIRVWNASTGQLLTKWPLPYQSESFIEAIDVIADPYSDIIYVGSDTGSLLTYDYNGSLLFQFCHEKAGIRKISQSQNLIASAFADGFIRVFNKKSGTPLVCWRCGNNQCMDVKISADEQFIFFASSSGDVGCLSLISNVEVWRRAIHSMIWTLFLSDTFLVCGSTDGAISFFNPQGTLISQLFFFPGSSDFLMIFPGEDFYYSTSPAMASKFLRIMKDEKEISASDPLFDFYVHSRNKKNLARLKISSPEKFTALSHAGLSARPIPNVLSLNQKN